MYCVSLSLAPADVAACASTWMHAQKCTRKPAPMHVLIYTSKQLSFAQRQETLCNVPNIKCFPRPLSNAAGEISICIEWTACLLHNKRSLHKLDINTDGFCLWLSLMLPTAVICLTQICLLVLFLVLFEQSDATVLKVCPCVQQPHGSRSTFPHNSAFLQHQNITYTPTVIRYKME